MGVGTVELVSQSEYARRRGCTEGAVRRAVRDGRITLIGDKIDPVAADAQWQRNTRPRAGSRSTNDANLQADAPSAGREDDGANSYWQSKARREAAEALLAELKLAEQQGQLVPIADVRSELAKVLAALRESLLQVPARLAPVLAAEADQAKVFALLQDEIHTTLRQVVRQ